MSTNLAGGYDLNKSNLTAKGLHLVIGTRHKPQGAKPKKYLLARFPDKTHKYISSLYPVKWTETAQIFTFDWKGVEYTLTLKTAQNRAEIEPCKEVAAQSS